MNDSTVGVTDTRNSQLLGHERLLGIPDVCQLTGFGKATASKFMKESGRAIRVHGRLFLLQSSLFAFLHEMEASDPCSL
jgi:hypothetical protein